MATATKTLKAAAVNDTALDFSITVSPNAAKMIKAANDASSTAPTNTSDAGNLPSITSDYSPSQSDDSSAPEDASSKLVGNQYIEELAAEIVEKNRAKAEQARCASIAEQVDGQRVAESKLATRQSETRCTSAPMLSLDASDKQSNSGNEDSEKITRNLKNALRPLPAGPVLIDRPPLVAKHPDPICKEQTDNGPRNAPTNPVEGPAMGRFEAVPEPIRFGLALPTMAPEQSVDQRSVPQPQNTSPFLGGRTHVPAFYENTAWFMQGVQGPFTNGSWNRLSSNLMPGYSSVPMQHPVPVRGFNGPHYSPPQAGPYPLTETSFQRGQVPVIAQPQNRRISNLRYEQSGNWQQNRYDDLHGPTYRRAPQTQKQQYRSTQHQSFGLHNGNDNVHFDYGRQGSNASSHGPNQPFAKRHTSIDERGVQSEMQRLSTALNQTGKVGSRNQARLPHMGSGEGYRERSDTASSNRSGRCLNYERYHLENNAAYVKYEPCGCLHCDTKDRSVFVGQFNHGQLTSCALHRIQAVFSQFGLVRDLKVRSHDQYILIE
ncbi:hypothetical protein BJ170DRAFT_159700 [Xylariales sp. AK1849]|nr:hypothetical protein BJ170DRAFT_159700 [Xylariales sp. AK1849]